MRNENPSRIRDYSAPGNKSGFVYVRVGKEDGVPLWELRKPPRMRGFRLSPII